MTYHESHASVLLEGVIGNRGKMPGAAADQAGRIFALT
jgi:hypothetical protein